MPKPRTTPPKPATATPAGERIAKVLARAGLASRRDAEVMIAQGRVRVNGAVIISPALNIGPRDRVLVDGKPLPAAEPPRLWLYHKPTGIVSTARDEKGRATVFDALPEDMPRVMSVGRLDLNSEGLLLLTNDGALKRKLELPATGWLRKYRVRVNGTPDEARLAPLRRGITVEGEVFQPMSVSIDRQQGANAWLTIGIREGRNREIRRAMEAVGLVVNRLIRTAYGPFALGDLEPGGVRELSARALRDQLGLVVQDAPATARPARPLPAPDAARKPRKPQPGKSAPKGATELDAPQRFKSWGSKSRPKPDGEAPTRARGTLSHRASASGSAAPTGTAKPRPTPTGKPAGTKPGGAKPGGAKPGGANPGGANPGGERPGASRPGPKPPRRP